MGIKWVYIQIGLHIAWYIENGKCLLWWWDDNDDDDDMNDDDDDQGFSFNTKVDLLSARNQHDKNNIMR